MWMLNSDFLAQAGHFLLGVAVVLASYILGDVRWAIVATVALEIYAVVKEVWIDPRIELDPFKYSGALDLAVITLGGSVGWNIIFIAR